jgi:hypothetical protein
MPNGFTPIVTTVFLLIFVATLLLGMETKGKVLGFDVELTHRPQASSRVVPV